MTGKEVRTGGPVIAGSILPRTESAALGVTQCLDIGAEPCLVVSQCISLLQSKVVAESIVKA